MSNADVARNVLTFMRLHYKRSVKSGNKMRKDETPDAARLERANALVGFLRTMNFESATFWQHYYGGGNCYDLAMTASRVALGRAPDTPVCVLGINSPGDHAVCTIGGSSDEVCFPFEAWSRDVWICDPWANIACAGPDYPDAFLKKMENWHGKRKRILYNNEWIAPVDARWLLHNISAPHRVMFTSSNQ